MHQKTILSKVNLLNLYQITYIVCILVSVDVQYLNEAISDLMGMTLAVLLIVVAMHILRESAMNWIFSNCNTD